LEKEGFALKGFSETRKERTVFITKSTAERNKKSSSADEVQKEAGRLWKEKGKKAPETEGDSNPAAKMKEGEDL